MLSTIVTLLSLGCACPPHGYGKRIAHLNVLFLFNQTKNKLSSSEGL
jgi:hypothetical protein